MDMRMSPPQYFCEQCAFEMGSEHDEELIDPVQEHRNEHHDLSVQADDIRAGWERVGSANELLPPELSYI